MEDEYFDEKMKQTLANPPIYAPSIEEVEAFRRRLNPSPGKGFWGDRFTNALLLIGIAWLAFLGLIKINQLQEQLLVMEQRMADLPMPQQSSVVKQYSYHRDTVFLLRNTGTAARAVSGRYQSSKGNNWSYHTPRVNFKIDDSFVASWSTEEPHFILFDRFSGSSLFPLSPKGNREDDVAPRLDERRQLPIAKLATLYPGLSLNNEAFLSKRRFDLTPPQKAKQPFLRHLQPAGVAGEITIMPVATHLNLAESFTYASGVGGEVFFSGGRSLSLGLLYQGLDFELKSEASFTGFPTVVPITSTDRLREVNGFFRYLNLPIRLRQTFNVGRNIRPQLGFGVVGVRPLNRQLVYRFSNSVEDYNVNEVIDGGAWSFKTWEIIAGGACSLGPQLSMSASLQYQHSFGLPAGSLLKRRIIGLQVGLQRQF